MTGRWPAISELAKRVQSKQTTAADLVAQAHAAIYDHKEYNAIISVISDRAKARAQEIDKQIKNGEKVGRLAGVPFIAKDNFLTFGSNTTAASNMLKNFKAPYQATAIERLEAEGAICVAKANLDAFAHGSSTENSDFMVTKNPHDRNKVPGGSSGGSAAAVVLDMVPFALGTDTGGSIRLPASFCGAVGYKPTYGLVSRSGVVAMASSTDVIGPLARSVEDAALVIDCMAGLDELDSTTIERNESTYVPSNNSKKYEIGIIKQYMDDGLEPGVKNNIDRAIKKLRDAGHTISEVSMPSLPLALACYYIIMPAEVSSNLSRYDGQKYGYSYKEAATIEESYKLSRSQGFGREAKRRIMIGTYVLSSGYYDAYYKKAQQIRTKLIEEFHAAFKSFDFLMGPVAPTTAFNIGEKANDPLKMYLADIMTVGVNLVGSPAISIPAGKDEHGMPVGIQLMAPTKDDKKLLEISAETERILL